VKVARGVLRGGKSARTYLSQLRSPWDNVERPAVRREAAWRNAADPPPMRARLTSIKGQTRATLNKTGRTRGRPGRITARVPRGNKLVKQRILAQDEELRTLKEKLDIPQGDLYHPSLSRRASAARLGCGARETKRPRPLGEPPARERPPWATKVNDCN
jgi:hypothetical protein